jgi:hypothetical protein
MTDLSAERATASERRGRDALGAMWATAAIFLTLLALLATRVATGRDPALRARAAATPPPARQVLIRRVYERRVIVHLPPSAPARASRASQQVSSTVGPAAPPPITRTS